jgi:hypothetical protein
MGAGRHSTNQEGIIDTVIPYHPNSFCLVSQPALRIQPTGEINSSDSRR